MPTDDVWEIAPQLTRPATTRGESKEARVRQVTIFRWQREAAPTPPEPGPTPEAESATKPAKGRSRGIGGTVLDAAGDKAAAKVVDRWAGTVGRKIERNRLGGNEPGLYQQPLAADLDRFQAKDGFEGNGPLLLFIHGTMSSFKGSFSDLWSAGATGTRRQLAKQYGNAYAWEHYTLTESPIENALALAEKLPAQAKLHLVSHSRGGLVGDLLCLGQREAGEEPLSTARILDLFRMAAGVGDPTGDDNPYRQQATHLGKLIEVLETNKIQVERFVRVACPARGTTLASNRLDRWLSIFKLLGDLALPAKFPLKLLLALIAEHADPRTLPGLEAMMPGSPLVRLLNFQNLKVRADLSVIAGDTEAGGLLGRLKEFVLDRFFEDESDIVVNTGAMYGGLRRSDGGRFYLDRGAAVNHFSYFGNATTSAMLVAGLLRADNANAGFLPLSSAEQKDPARAAQLRRVPQGPRPVVFLLPGILGSHLKVDGDRIWLAIDNLVPGRFGRLAVDAQGVAPDALFDDYYGRLADYLEQTHEVIRFPYDWRLSLLEAGKRLAQQVTAKLNEQEQKKTGQPVRILAHSMGGLVVRAMLAQQREVWQRMTTHPGARLVMLGTPNEGSYEIVNLLVGRATTLQQLALLDITRRAQDLLEIINRFPGVLELLPTDNNLGCFQASYWQNLRRSDEDRIHFPWPVPRGADLQQAQRTWRLLQTAGQVDNTRTLYVAGSAPATLIGWRVETEFEYDPQPRSWKTLVFEATRRGDGRVPWDTGIPPGVKTWYLADVEHGSLPSHEAAFPAYLELLQAGVTSRLPMTPPAGVRAAAIEQRFALPPVLPATLPDESDLAASVLGATRRKQARRVSLPKVSLSITHGDLSYARYPVAVGHYRGDTIVSAEDYLDRALQGRLRKRHRLDLYPGRLGTCEIFLNPSKYDRPGGAIVIGLGQVGELSPGGLESAFAQAALSYALQVAECPDDRFGAIAGVPRSARISALLIGTGAGGMTVRDAIGSILRGVAHANRRLHELGLSDSVWIDQLEFLELWQDVAIQAAAALE
ncbi:MAG: hypothetical protein U1F76_17505 [Candidatus Competibacteraceae bacterium]